VADSGQLRQPRHCVPQGIPFIPTVLLAFGAGCAANTQRASVSLPAPLVTALLDDRGSPTRPAPDYTVGKLPPGYPATLVPSGPVSIVGGMTAGDQIVAVFADSTRRLAAVFEQLFEHAGFSRPAPSPGSGFMSGSGPYSFFCGDSGMVSVEPLTGSNRTFARVSYRRGRGAASCQRVDRVVSPNELKLPELTPPTGVRVARSHGGSNSDGVNSSAEMTGTALVASTILAHYAAELVAAGWTTASPAVGDRVAAQFFGAKDASGAPWEGVLIAAGGRTSLTVSLTMQPHVNR